MCVSNAQPTNARECRSMTVARYAHPSHVLMYVMSPHHLVFASVAVKFRPIRSGAGAGLSPATVVTFHVTGCGIVAEMRCSEKLPRPNSEGCWRYRGSRKIRAAVGANDDLECRLVVPTWSPSSCPGT